ncbi:MAG: outer membrane beta-barrel protein [Hyphomicrobiaceae bacterium]
MVVMWLKRAAGLLVALTVGAGAAAAQNFDGTGIVKFGAFGQGTWMKGSDTKWQTSITDPFATSGIGGGFSAAYDLVSPNRWMLGVEIDGSFADSRDLVAGYEYGFDYAMSIRARAGLFPTPGWLLYGTAGFGWVGLEVQEPGSVGNKAAETIPGFVGGVGTEIDWHHVIVFGEYLYGTYDDRNFEFFTGRHDLHDVETHMLRIGMKFKVGHDYTHDLDTYDRHYEPLK